MKKRAINGWVVIDKPNGMTSTALTTKVRNLFYAKKAGHGGTLDPMATGVLPIALGEATKALPYVFKGRKNYRFTVTWGEQRTTDDAEGELLYSSGYIPSTVEIKSALNDFKGEIEQLPPQYSALKVNGKRAYDLARRGESVELKPRTVHIYKYKLLKSSNLKSAAFEVICSKGTYVRSLARDLALKLGTYGYVSSLRRLAAYPFEEKDAISLDSLTKIGHNNELESFILPISEALDDIPAIEISQDEVKQIRHGQSLLFKNDSFKEGAEILLSHCKMSVAIATIKLGRICPKRVFQI